MSARLERGEAIDNGVLVAWRKVLVAIAEIDADKSSSVRSGRAERAFHLTQRAPHSPTPPERVIML